MLGRRGGDLSGGQQQQLAIGRALVMRPKLLLLDEPTEGIQPSIIKDIGRAISYLRSLGNMAIVLVEQYLDFACELGDNFAVMDRGAVKYACDRSQSRSRRNQPPDGAVNSAATGRSRLGDGCGPIPRSAASAIFAANRAQGAVTFDVHLRSRASPAAASCMNPARCACAFRRPRRKACRRCSSTPPAASPAATVSTSTSRPARDRGLTVTTAAAEKVYRAQGPAAELNIALKAAAGAHLAWLPQETILFDRARVSRRIDIDLAEGASLLLCEIVVFGRAAMGERMLQGEFVDRWRLRRGGRLVFAETVRLDGDIGEKLARPAVANGGVAIGTALIVPGDEALVERIREAREFVRRRGRHLLLEWICNGALLCPRCGPAARRHDGGARPRQRRGAAAAVAQLESFN